MRALPIVAILAACATDPRVPDEIPPEGERLAVHLLGGGMVESNGRRMPLDEFVYELRVACRAAGDGPPPWLAVTAPREERPDLAEMVVELRQQAYEAGVRHVELDLEDA